MKERNYKDISMRLLNIEERGLKVLERKNEFVKVVNEHNERLDKLLNGYVALGLLDELAPNLYTQVLTDAFQNEIAKLLKVYEKNIEGFAESQLKSNHYHDAIEKNISDMLVLTVNRWNTLSDFLVLWESDRKNLRDSELELYNDFKRLFNNMHQIDQLQWKSDSDTIFDQLFDQIEKHERTFDKEESALEQMDAILKLREQLYTTAKIIF